MSKLAQKKIGKGLVALEIHIHMKKSDLFLFEKGKKYLKIDSIRCVNKVFQMVQSTQTSV